MAFARHGEIGELVEHRAGDARLEPLAHMDIGRRLLRDRIGLDPDRIVGAGDRLVADINATGYGLTFGIHSRIDSTVRRVASRINAGNVYVNRNIIGAVVGTQPFGGCGLSGTGPKAGGPRYLHRFAHERTVTINTSAVGGNASLLAME